MFVLAILFLVLIFMCGYEAAAWLVLDQKGSGKSVNRIWVMLPAAYGAGTLFLVWPLYFLGWLLKELGMERPLYLGNALVMSTAAVFLVLRYRGHIRRQGSMKNWITEQKKLNLAEPLQFRKELLWFVILLVFYTATVFYVFRVSGGSLLSGFTVFGDYAPHTAMMRSFSRGANFPTQYPHFGGADIKYHFMFQFFAGNLEFLGMRIDFAYNIASILALTGFSMLLYAITRRIFRSFAVGVLTQVFFLFRSSFTFPIYVIEHFLAGDLGRTLAENEKFIGYTRNEDWGLYCYNVYLNQRHLAFGLIIVSLAIWIFLEYLEDSCSLEMKTGPWFISRIFSVQSWKCINLRSAILVGVLVGMTAFWNGAAVIGGLLILCCFAMFSEGKIDYAVMAAVTIALAMIQKTIFIQGSAFSAAFQWGFLADDRSLTGVIYFVLLLTGIFYMGLIPIAVVQNRLARSLTLAFLFPTIFAFTMSLTPDIAVNHKYIMISLAFLGMFWAKALTDLAGTKKISLVLCAILLGLLLTVTGLYEFVIILRDNGAKHSVYVQLESEPMEWMSENLTHEDLILTPEYSMNEFTMSGSMLYYGWPYYAWSAGYDMSRRAAMGTLIYTSYDPQEIRAAAQEEGITYVLYEEGMRFDENVCHEETIADTFDLVYTTPDGIVRIYKTVP